MAKRRKKKINQKKKNLNNKETRYFVTSKVKSPKKKVYKKVPKKESLGEKIYDFTNSLFMEVKIGLKMAFKRDLDLNDYIYSFASKEEISFALACIILVTCFQSLGQSKRVEAQMEIGRTIEDVIADNKVDEDSIMTLSEIVDGVVDSYEIAEIELTLEEKLSIVCDKYGVTREEFMVIAAILLLEGGPNNYEECYKVTCTLYNRIKNSSFVALVNKCMGSGTGYNIYYQAICPSQYTTYKTEDYYKLIKKDLTTYKGFAAIVDMLFSEETVFDYCRFVAPHLKDTIPTDDIYDTGHNCFWRHTLEEEMVSLEDKLPNYTKYTDVESSYKVLQLKPTK